MENKRYLDVDNFIWWCKVNISDLPSYDDIIKYVEMFPISNAKEIKYGKWNTYNIGGLFECSECNAVFQVDWVSNAKMSYCPNCGASMQTKLKST